MAGPRQLDSLQKTMVENLDFSEVPSSPTRLLHRGHKDIICDPNLPFFWEAWYAEAECLETAAALHHPIPRQVVPFLNRAASGMSHVALIAVLSA